MEQNPYAYTIEKLTTTLECLATNPGDARQRLTDTFLCFHMLTENDFPEELRKEWRQVIHEMNKFGPVMNIKGEIIRTSVENTMRRIRNATASKIAKRIYALYWAISTNVPYQ